MVVDRRAIHRAHKLASTLDRALLQELRADPGRATLDNLFQEIAKLERLRALQLPPTLFDGLTPTVLQAYRQRVAVEEPYELRRHAVPLRITLLAAYCLLRGRELTDILAGSVHMTQDTCGKQVLPGRF